MIWVYALVSVWVISVISLISIVFLWLKHQRLKKIVIYLVSLAAGALIWDVFLHLLPELIEENGYSVAIAGYIIAGIVFSLVVEKIIHRRHCHLPTTKNHIHPFAYMNLVGDAVHNLIDWLIIGASYLVSIPVGIATTIAVIFHEIPQEIGDYGVLIHGGFSKKKAILINFLTALTAIIWVILALRLGQAVESVHTILVPFAIGSFLYIAGADLIPEMHKETARPQATVQILFFLAGVATMYGLLFIETYGH